MEGSKAAEPPPTAHCEWQQRFGQALGLVARLWRGEIDRRLSPFGLTESRWQTLLHLSCLGDGVTQRELAEAVGVQGPTLVRTLDWLEAEGLIERRTTTADRRIKSVYLSPDALPTLARIETVVASVRAEILSGLPGTDMATCTRVLEYIAGKLGASLSPTRLTPEPDQIARTLAGALKDA